MDLNDQGHAYRWPEQWSWRDDAPGQGHGHGDCGAAQDPGEVGGGEPAAESWAGDRINVVWLAPNQQTAEDLGTYTADANVETITPPVDGFFLLLGTKAVDLVYTGTAQPVLPPDIDFVGFKFTDLSARPIESVEINDDSNIELRAGALDYGNNFVQVDLVGATIPGSSLLHLDLTFV